MCFFLSWRKLLFTREIISRQLLSIYSYCFIFLFLKILWFCNRLKQRETEKVWNTKWQWWSSAYVGVRTNKPLLFEIIVWTILYDTVPKAHSCASCPVTLQLPPLTRIWCQLHNIKLFLTPHSYQTNTLKYSWVINSSTCISLTSCFLPFAWILLLGDGQQIKAIHSYEGNVCRVKTKGFNCLES